MTSRSLAKPALRWASRRPPRWLTPMRLRAIRHGIVFAGIGGTVVAGLQSYAGPALDANAYWAARAPHLYETLPGTPGAYLYSPAFAQLIAPLQWLPADIFVGAWIAAMMLAIAWLAGPLVLPFALVVAWSEIGSANIHAFLALAIVVGFRFPAAWAFPLLTKVTPGIGLLWFVRRREWRSLAVAVGITLAVTTLSFIVDPRSWLDWFDLLIRSATAPALSLSAPVPLWLRLPLAALVVWWGAGRNARWTVPIGAMIALPFLWPASLTLLIACLPLIDDRRLRPRWREALA